jgi:hypothetical protein
MNKEEVVIISAFVGLHLFINTLMHGMENEVMLIISPFQVKTGSYQ